MDAYQRLFDAVDGERAVGESSACYMYFYDTAATIHAHIPDVQLIAVLRHPVERAYSHYRQAVMLGHETLSFREALEQQDKRRDANWRWHYQYEGQSRYYDQLLQYTKIFERGQLEIVFFEDLRDSPDKVMAQLWRFLHLEDRFSGVYTARNRTLGLRSSLAGRVYNGSPRVKRFARSVVPGIMRKGIGAAYRKLNYIKAPPPPMDRDVREMLTQRLRPQVLGLQEMQGRDLSDWLT